MGIFVRNFTRLLSDQIYTLSPSFIEIFLELTKLHSFNHDIPHFTVFVSMFIRMSIQFSLKFEITSITKERLPELIADCRQLLPAGFIFQQDGAPAHTARVTQDWLTANCHFINKNESPPNSPDLNPLDYHVWGAMLEKYHKLQPKPKTIDALKVVLQTIWRELPQAPIDKAVASFTKRLTACVAANGGHFEHVQ